MITITIFLLSVFAGTAAGQINPQSKASKDKDQKQLMEEITVIGQRTLGKLRVQIDVAEDRIFDIYNKLNTDDLYDIHCRRKEPTGSHIKFKTCSPGYYSMTEAEATSLSMSGVPGVGYMTAKLTYYNRIMGEKWKQLVKSNPELLHSVMEHYELSQELKKQHRAYFGLDN